jgi:hypothetical protein
VFHSSTVGIRVEYQLGAAYVTFTISPFLMVFFSILNTITEICFFRCHVISHFDIAKQIN